MNIKVYNQLLQDINSKNNLLIAVSKFQSSEDIIDLYNQGQRHFGENYVQELIQKHKTLPKDIVWHFIGTLQTNKIKLITPFINYIHSVDSEKLLQEIQKKAFENNRIIKVFVQVKVAQEKTKAGGIEAEKIFTLFENINSNKNFYTNIEFVGIMGMTSFIENNLQIKNEFELIYNTFKKIKTTFYNYDSNFKEISMGMSGDYLLAMQMGSTMVRIGSLIFGKRKIN